MKRYLITAALAVTTLTVACWAQSSAPDLAAAVKDLQTQQIAISDFQTKIDSKVEDVAEQVRLARLYVGRDGGKHVAPKYPKPPPAK